MRLIRSIDDLLDLAIPEPNSGCYLWLGTIASRDYGQLYDDGHKTYAHRLSWSLANNCEIPEGMKICHKCDVTLCINPYHLFLGTQADNLKDMSNKGRAKGNPTTPGHLRVLAKLDPEKVIYIRESKLGPVLLAKELGVHRNTITRVRNKTSYRKENDMKNCPYCGKSCDTVGVETEDEHGNKIVHYLHFCPPCNALEIYPGDDTSELTEREKECGWELIAKVDAPNF